MFYLVIWNSEFINFFNYVVMFYLKINLFTKKNIFISLNYMVVLASYCMFNFYMFANEIRNYTILKNNLIENRIFKTHYKLKN